MPGSCNLVGICENVLKLSDDITVTFDLENHILIGFKSLTNVGVFDLHP